MSTRQHFHLRVTLNGTFAVFLEESVHTSQQPLGWCNNCNNLAATNRFPHCVRCMSECGLPAPAFITDARIVCMYNTSFQFSNLRFQTRDKRACFVVCELELNADVHYAPRPLMNMFVVYVAFTCLGFVSRCAIQLKGCLTLSFSINTPQIYIIYGGSSKDAAEEMPMLAVYVEICIYNMYCHIAAEKCLK